jgi:hypothetical protein
LAKKSQNTVTFYQWPFTGKSTLKRPKFGQKGQHFTTLKNKVLGNFLGGLRWQWISAKMKVWHPWQSKKSKSKLFGPFWSYQINSTANSANLANIPGKWA